LRRRISPEEDESLVFKRRIHEGENEPLIPRR